MPLLTGLGLVAVFIWLAENVGTFAQAWVYPAQKHGWQPVAPQKIGAWLLLMTISYVMVWTVHGHAPRYGGRTCREGTETRSSGCKRP
jgi:uncharacterized membrane protein YoaT (DUF817 family)